MRKVLESIGLDDEEEGSDDDMADADGAPAVPGVMLSPPKKEKKKRKADSIEVSLFLDILILQCSQVYHQLDDEEPPAKVKKSKEERKKEKKEKKAKLAAEEEAEVEPEVRIMTFHLKMEPQPTLFARRSQ